jgi:hypothetical protein
MSCNCIPTISTCDECSIIAIELLTGIPGLPGSAGVDAQFLQGVPIQDVAPTTNQALVYNGTQWTPTTTTAGTY